MVWSGIPASPYSLMLFPSSQKSQPSASPSSFKATLRPIDFSRLWWRGREALAKNTVTVTSPQVSQEQRSKMKCFLWVRVGSPTRKCWELALCACRKGWTTACPKWMTSPKHQGEFSSRALKLKAHNWLPSFPFSEAVNLFHDPWPKTLRGQMGKVLRHYVRPTWNPIFFPGQWLSESYSSINPPLPYLWNGDDGNTTSSDFISLWLRKIGNHKTKLLILA